jgi:hypothetical protein
VKSGQVCSNFEGGETQPYSEPGLPSASPKSTVDETKIKPEIMAKLQKVLSTAPPNCVIVASLQGDILKSFRFHSSTLETYDNFESYVASKLGEPKKKPCRRTNDQCVLCPDGKIYCTNATKYERKKSDTF